ncbi:hypothetical protein [Streptomyces sp. NBC_01294]|uniref:hypothetical protein n=1 Tax=Streptomyces sp. NBC_01294 TaxID=2903815 RepID=UPI00308680EB|nr:hypothetical protein OG534_01050 [Streptomyces sp. NBC_01294]
MARTAAGWASAKSPVGKKVAGSLRRRSSVSTVSIPASSQAALKVSATTLRDVGSRRISLPSSEAGGRGPA